MHEILYCEPDLPTLAAAPGSYNPVNQKHIDSDVQKKTATQKCAEFCASKLSLSIYLAESVDLDHAKVLEKLLCLRETT
jgi:hypothetical protein